MEKGLVDKMAQLPKISKFQSEDFGKDQRKWIGKLLQPLNSFMQSVVSALDRNITINQNLQGEIKSVPVRGGSKVSFKYSPSKRPSVVLVGRVIDKAGVLVNAAITAVDWGDDGQGNITVNSISNLQNESDYTVTFLVLS